LFRGMVITGVLAVCASTVQALVGGESGAFLRTPVGAAASAMGGAGTAAPAYLSAWWNPAVLSTFTGRRAALGMGIRSQGRTEGFASFAFRIPPRVGMGMSLVYRGDPFLTNLRDRDENRISRGAYTTLTFKTALSYVVSRRLAVGGTLGIFYQSMPTGVTADFTPRNSAAAGIGGFDLGVHYRVRDDWMLAVTARNMGVSMDWEVHAADDGLSTTITDRPLPSFAVGSRLERRLRGRPFVWTCDAVGYIFDGSWRRLPRAEVCVSNGWEWRCWETFRLRAGIGDVCLNSNLLDDRKEYTADFSPRIAAGFGADLVRVREGLALNYAVSTDRVWAGIDQVLDITYAF
jgi:hypothetical protein